MSTYVRDYGAQLIADGRVPMARVDDAVRRILRVKFRAGLFEHPYADVTKATDEASFVTASDRSKARTRKATRTSRAKEDAAA